MGEIVEVAGIVAFVLELDAVLVAQETFKAAYALASFTDESYRVWTDQVFADQAAPYEPLQLRVLAFQSRGYLVQARNRYEAAWRQLAAALGEPAMAPVVLAGRVDAPLPTYPYADVLARINTRHTDVLTALKRRAPHVRVSLAEVMQWVNWKAASGAAASGLSPGREGRESEFQIVRCSDGHVAVVYTVTQWPATRTLIGDKRLEDAKFATRAGRRKHIAELYDIITPWFTGKTRAEIQKAAQSKGVPFGPIFSPAELLDSEQYVTRSFLAEMKHPALGRLLMPQLPVQWNGRSFAPRPAPEIARSELAA